ncbi:carbonic anhydrase [Actinomadura sp. B10D3]|uniref:carbonic anhydrase n=1 Tax=Actinomadura sp. B10D3 TaxID=3153557 RepID=UPI00325E7B5B
MHALIEHARSFRDRAAADGAPLAPLAEGQTPLALFIACSDSRVVPSLITGAKPGELFELRTAGGIVPRYSLDRPSAEAATIEFAVEVLRVADVVVCGHSHCAAVAALARGDDLTTVPAMAEWLSAASDRPDGLGADGLDRAVQRHVVAQMERLRAHPAIRRRLDQGRIALHGWFYEVHTGTVLTHRTGADTFRPL